MTWTYTEEYYKSYTRDTWNESAPHYEPLALVLDQATPALLRRVRPRAGDRVLDVATGPGEPARTIARRVAPTGSVLGIDLSERMIEIARSNAMEEGLANATFQVMDAEALALPDASFDVAVSRFGLQIVTDPERTIAEMRRVLKPGGRFAASVWGPGERTPAIHAIVGPMLEHAEPDEAGYLPTPYEMGGEGELAALLAKAGFREVREERATLSWSFADAQAYLDVVLRGSPLGHSLAEEDEAVQRVVLEKTRANLRAWTGADGRIELPAEYVVVSALR